MSEITVHLNSESIQDAIAKLEQIKQNVSSRANMMISKLLEIGITTAQQNTGKYAGYIKFETMVEESQDGYVGLLIASDAEKIISRWRRGGEIIEAEVSPLLMAEFGSGQYAEVKDLWSELAGVVGQGTFTYPDQIRNHAFDPMGWGWYDLDGKWHWSKGEYPTYPMYESWQAMKDALETVITSVLNL